MRGWCHRRQLRVWHGLRGLRAALHVTPSIAAASVSAASFATAITAAAAVLAAATTAAFATVSGSNALAAAFANDRGAVE